LPSPISHLRPSRFMRGQIREGRQDRRARLPQPAAARASAVIPVRQSRVGDREIGGADGAHARSVRSRTR
jgi:hypothetical protein